MRKTSRTLLTAAALITSLIGATAVFAQDQQTPAQPPAAHEQNMPAMKQGEGMGMGMMGEHGKGTMGQGDDMMPMAKMMTQMSEMMENCNKMMQAKAQQPDQGAAPQKQGG